MIIFFIVDRIWLAKPQLFYCLLPSFGMFHLSDSINNIMKRKTFLLLLLYIWVDFDAAGLTWPFLSNTPPIFRKNSPEKKRRIAML